MREVWKMMISDSSVTDWSSVLLCRCIVGDRPPRFYSGATDIRTRHRVRSISGEPKLKHHHYRDIIFYFIAAPFMTSCFNRLPCGIPTQTLRGRCLK